MTRDWRVGFALLLFIIGVSFWLSYTEDYALFRATEVARMNGLSPSAPVWCFADCPNYPSNVNLKRFTGTIALVGVFVLLGWSFFRPRR